MLKQFRHIRFTKLNGRSLSSGWAYLSAVAFAKGDCAQQDNSMNPIGMEKNYNYKRPWYIQT